MTPGHVWVRHTWRLGGPPPCGVAPAGYEVAPDRLLDADAAYEVVVAAYESDEIWRPEILAIRARMRRRIDETFGRRGAAYLGAYRLGTLVAVSGVARRHWTGQNLLTGVCVHPSHQRRGIGTALLAASLTWLRDTGHLSEAVVYTELGSIADTKLYPRCGSSREVGVDYPGARDQGDAPAGSRLAAGSARPVGRRDQASGRS